MPSIGVLEKSIKDFAGVLKEQGFIVSLKTYYADDSNDGRSYVYLKVDRDNLPPLEIDFLANGHIPGYNHVKASGVSNRHLTIGGNSLIEMKYKAQLRIAKFWKITYKK